MKILFPGPGEVLVCGRCGEALDSSLASSEDGDIDYRWCENCVDYQSPKVVRFALNEDVIRAHRKVMRVHKELLERLAEKG